MKAYHWRHLIAERHRLAALRKGEPAPDAPDVQVTLPPKREPPAAVAPPTRPILPVVSSAPRIVMRTITTPGRYACVECAHYERRYCTNGRARHPVTGEYVEAMAARKDKASCGPSGRYWDARYETPRPQREADDSEPMEYVPPVPVRKLEPFQDGVIVSLLKIMEECR